jgi:ribosomal protein L12E/L44/L45/RPP1/RPP2
MNTKKEIALICALLVAVGLSACSRARSDAEITAEVQGRIHADATLAAAPVTVQSSSGVVVLTGNVETDAARTSAENAARQVKGVKAVINNLQVVAAAAPMPPPQSQFASQASKKAKPAKAGYCGPTARSGTGTGDHSGRDGFDGAADRCGG